MLYRKIEEKIKDHLINNPNQILLIDGARQVGKTTTVETVGQQLFANFIEINMAEDALQNKYFSNIQSPEDFYFQLSFIAGNKMGFKEDTLIFIDEIQTYPYLLTLLKFLAKDNRYTYIASGSLLGITLLQTPSIPIGSIIKLEMYPLDFEEFLYANGMNNSTIASLMTKFINKESLNEQAHNQLMNLFKRYLLVGGMPQAVNTYIQTNNLYQIRLIQQQIHEYYGDDASKYDSLNKLKIKRIYDLIPSNMENKKKRIFAQTIEGKKGKSFPDYQDEFEYLIRSGISINVQAISNPRFPLIKYESKNLLKLYLNDVGLLTSILYGNNSQAILSDTNSINLGSVYETVVANELKKHGYTLFYYDNRNKGEVDFLIDDYNTLSITPIEVKSGKDYTIHSALNHFITTQDYHCNNAYVLNNNRQIITKNKITYLPIYFIMFFNNEELINNDYLI